MRGQVSIEYVMIVGFSLLIIIPAILAGIGTSQLHEARITERQLERISFTIVTTADELAFEGPPAKRTIRVYIPSGIESITTEQRTIVMRYNAGPGSREVVLTSTYANLTWDAPIPAQGYRNLVLTSTATGVHIT
ncbi:MAG: hypothetical protein ACMXYM_00345 [Candidatus Woesearchaeota archaeon]